MTAINWRSVNNLLLVIFGYIASLEDWVCEFFKEENKMVTRKVQFSSALLMTAFGCHP